MKQKLTKNSLKNGIFENSHIHTVSSCIMYII